MKLAIISIESGMNDGREIYGVAFTAILTKEELTNLLARSSGQGVTVTYG